jgi:pyruvate/2-oxoglutarate dehydrogenase complex dihydrolipoamide dehydrogenase (E3) component
MGLELAQAHNRLGSRVMVLEAEKALGREDPELSKFVLERLSEEGVSVHEGTKIERIEAGLGRVRVHVSVGGEQHVVEGSHILIATGRKPVTGDLGLETAGIKYDARGIKVNRGLKTSNGRVYAIGDVAGEPMYAHAADYQAHVLLRRLLFRLPARVNSNLIPRVTFTDPELAHVGQSEREAAQGSAKIRVLRWPYRENDRAQIERGTVGHIKVVTAPNGKILGASIVGTQASELIQMWALAISQGMNIRAMTEWISPYPTLGEINKRAAYSYYATVPSSPMARKVINFLAKFG